MYGGQLFLKNEADVCTIIKNSLLNGSKIPDPSGAYTHTSQRTFDGIGAIEKKDGLHFVCWEAKYLKSMSAFPFSKIEPHQNYYLNVYNKCIGVISYVILGVNVARGDQRIYVFEWNDFMGELYENKFSIHKDKLEKLPYNEVHKGTFNFDNIITKDILSSTFGDMDLILKGLIEKNKPFETGLSNVIKGN